jgi:hypothetical protein
MGKLVIQLQHVPDWQLVLWNEPEGELVRALAWAGPTEVSKVLRQLTKKFPRRLSADSRTTHPSSLSGYRMPCDRRGSRV